MNLMHKSSSLKSDDLYADDLYADDLYADDLHADDLHALAHEKGFTILEILIAMMILSFSLVALFGHQGVAIQASDYSNRVSQATFLLQGKMLDVKHKILSESIDVFDQCDEGDFRDEGFRSSKSNKYRWKVCTFKIEIQEGATTQFAERLGGLIMGASGDNNTSLPGMMGRNNTNQSNGKNGMDKFMGQIAQMAGFIPMFFQQLEEQIRKVKIEVSWRDQTQERSIIIERFVTSLGSDGSAGAPPPEDTLANENKQEIEEQLRP